VLGCPGLFRGKPWTLDRFHWCRCHGTFICEHRLAPFICEHRLAPFICEHRLAPFIREHRLAPFICEHRLGTFDWWQGCSQPRCGPPSLQQARSSFRDTTSCATNDAAVLGTVITPFAEYLRYRHAKP
jgi:hypothetical protein